MATTPVSQAVTDRLIDDWKQAWKKLSILAFAFIGALPDIYDAIIAMNWLDDQAVPESFRWALRLAAVGGIILRLVKQKSGEIEKQYETLDQADKSDEQKP